MCLLTSIDQYLRRTGMTPTRFGRLAVNDPRLVRDLKAGREPGLKVRTRVEAMLREDRPPSGAGRTRRRS